MKLVALIMVVASVAIIEGTTPDVCPTSDRSSRTQCGLPGITLLYCHSLGCCFDSQYGDAHNCFHTRAQATTQGQHYSSTSSPRSTFAQTKGNCGTGPCISKAVAVVPIVGHISHGDNHFDSTFGSEANGVVHNAWLGRDASVNAHLAKTSRKSGPFSMDAVAGKVGAHAGANLVEGINVGVSATLAEVEGRVGLTQPGLKWVGVGGKLGLGAETGFSVGPLGANVKVLGSGVGFNPDKGFSFCLFGSCVYLG